MLNLLFYNHLYNWYESNHRVLPWRETEDGYAIWLSEIILQQTRVAQGLDYYMRFIHRWPTVEALAAADESEVLREWQGLGYYSRARNLHKAAKLIVESREARAESREAIFPRTFEEIRALPGVGDYTAGAIASFAYNLPYPGIPRRGYGDGRQCISGDSTPIGYRRSLRHLGGQETLSPEDRRTVGPRKPATLQLRHHGVRSTLLHARIRR